MASVPAAGGRVGDQARPARIRLKKDFEEDLPQVHGDEQMLKQVFMNLILNAVGSRAPGGVIGIGLRMGKGNGS